MTDREEFEIKEFFAIYDKLEGYSDSDKSIALGAWQTRGELDDAKIKELEIRNAELQAQVFKTVFYDRNLNELTAKLDKAKEALKDLIKENIDNREYNSKKSIYNITAEKNAVNLLLELDK